MTEPDPAVARQRAKADRRAAYNRQRIDQAAAPADKLHAAWAWLTAELAHLAKTDPGHAAVERARLTNLITGWAADYNRAPAPDASTKEDHQ